MRWLEECTDDNISKENLQTLFIKSYWTYTSSKSTGHSIVYGDDLVVVMATVPTSPLLNNSDCLNVLSEVEVPTIFNP